LDLARPTGKRFEGRLVGANIGKNIEAARVAPKTKKAAAVGKLLRPDALERCTELGKRIVRRGCADNITA